MPKKRDFVRVSTRAPRFREGTDLMKVHETMVDFIKGSGPSGSFMDILGAAGIFNVIQNIDVVPERDLIYSDDEDEDENFNEPNHSPDLKPHPQLKEIDDEEAEQIKESLEEQKRKSKSVKNKRKKMRKREKKRQEKEEGDLNASPEEDQGNSSENEDLDEETNIDNYKKNDNSIPKLSDKTLTEEKNDTLRQEEKIVVINKKKDKPPENIELKNSKPSITESVPEKKSKNKSKKIEKAQITQNNKVEDIKVKLPKKELQVDKPVKVETKKNTEIKQEEKKSVNKEESVDSMVEEYAKKSKEMAAIGNKLAANGQHEMAIKCFTEAIKFNPREYKLFGNRSFCFEKMQRFEEALSDAEVSLSMEPNWIKGLFRKGKALCGLKKYYEASLAYGDLLNLDSTSQEARMELKRAQTLHLMEMGFTWTQSSNALKRHSSLEEAVEALFNGECNFSPEEHGACQLDVSQLPRPGPSFVNNEWEDVQLPTKYKFQIKEKLQQQPPFSKKQGKMEVFPVWVGSLAPTVNYMTLQEVFSRAGKVFSIKMVLEHQCAFVNYTRKEDSARAIQLLNGLVVEGCPLAVRYPSRIPPGIGVSKDALTDPLTPPSVEKECFFWRTIGCTRDDCTFKHIPENKGIDRGRFNHKLTHNY